MFKLVKAYLICTAFIVNNSAPIVHDERQ